MATPATLVNKSMLTLNGISPFSSIYLCVWGGGVVFGVWDNITQISDQNSESLGHSLLFPT